MTGPYLRKQAEGGWLKGAAPSPCQRKGPSISMWASGPGELTLTRCLMGITGRACRSPDLTCSTRALPEFQGHRRRTSKPDGFTELTAFLIPFTVTMKLPPPEAANMLGLAFCYVDDYVQYASQGTINLQRRVQHVPQAGFAGKFGWNALQAQ